MNTDNCTAAIHGTWAAYKNHRCRCPEITQRVRSSPSWRSRHVPVRSTIEPGRGPHRADPDPVAVLRVIGGERRQLSTVDRRAAIDRLDRQGLSAPEIARRLGCSERTVNRRRATLREQRELVA